ncbi:probable WRKY transcription factor 14 [Typha angustifolia]|uniref:probable WRKY transcription factor 14 n=1 Tax=Typha angustifolia TaxID=59011 RepID=UPI003C2F0AE2
MCDYFWQRMEDDQGDLADIVARAGGHGLSATVDFPIAGWQLPSGSMSFPQPLPADGPSDDFGDPFANFRDPLLDELSAVDFCDAADAMPGSAEARDGGELVAGKMLIGGEERQQKPCAAVFSRVLQISPDAAKAMRAIKPSPVVRSAGDMVKVGGGGGCADHVPAGMQISSPRTLGIKRRKSQPKKVICIPAPPPAAGAGSNRPGGEVVPSDLWAWRKYGQKPIKGSPYPRGYYRCSSSKGCSARKQVERSRTDPNMLVITYTSEHNHPWPTQRNALAGSTKSHASKNTSSKMSPRTQKPPPGVKEEAKEIMTCASFSPLVKEEEAGELIDHKAVDASEEAEYNGQVFHQSYKPMIPDSNQSDDFFADLAELEPDPMSLIFSKELMGAKPDERRGDKASLDAFNVFDWASSSFGEAKKGL